MLYYLRVRRPSGAADDWARKLSCDFKKSIQFDGFAVGIHAEKALQNPEKQKNSNAEREIWILCHKVKNDLSSINPAGA